MASKQSSSLYLFFRKQEEAENSKLDEDLGELWCDLFCFAFFVLKAGDEMFLFFYFPMQRQHLMKTYVVQGGQVKQGSVSEYPKIPKISPSMYKPLQI